MSARLHVLLGGGGVGKTTLAAGYALALAQRGARVGLLGIDPSRRLQDALGVELADLDVPVPDAGGLRAAIVQPHQAIVRWVAEAHADADAAARLAQNPFFVALGDRLATATDVLAAVRIAEWAEHDPALDELVVDTAPGVAALDFLRAPRQIAALVDGPLVGWLRAAARVGDRDWLGLRAGARRVLGAFAGIAGAALVAQLADFFALVRAPLEHMIARVDRARRWLRADDTELLIVTSPRDADAAGALELATALHDEHLRPRAVIVNRTWPTTIADELARLDAPADARALIDHARALLAAQAEVIAAASPIAPTMVSLPAHAGLDLARRAALVELGLALWHGLPRSPS